MYDDGCRTEIFAKCRIGVGVLRSNALMLTPMCDDGSQLIILHFTCVRFMHCDRLTWDWIGLDWL